MWGERRIAADHRGRTFSLSRPAHKNPMPINESWRPSNLTQQQQQEAMEAIYGLGERGTMTPNTELTYEERIKLRRMLDGLDQKEAGGHKEFDLNKPPASPYTYREYPRLMFRHDTGAYRPAHNHEERLQMEDAGWSADPVAPAPPPEVELTAEEMAEVNVVDRQLKKKK
jgi:hypothetical protein